MQINETTYNAMPAHLRALFVKLPNPGKEEVLALFPGEGDKSAARFMYCAKASKRDRDEGLDQPPEIHRVNGNRVTRGERPPSAESGPRRNVHPTVKPTDLMRYLCRLVTPPGGVVLDPFMGSGSTGKAAALEGFGFIGIDINPEYSAIACCRIEDAQRQGRLIALVLTLGTHND